MSDHDRALTMIEFRR